MDFCWQNDMSDTTERLNWIDLQWLEAGFGFPAREWAGSWWWKHQVLAVRPVVSDKDSELRLYRKEFPQRQKVVMQVKCLLGGKGVQYMWIGTWSDPGGGSLSHACGSLNYFCGIFLLGFRWPIILICLVCNPYLMYLRITLPGVCMHLLDKMDFTEKAYG